MTITAIRCRVQQPVDPKSHPLVVLQVHDTELNRGTYSPWRDACVEDLLEVGLMLTEREDHRQAAYMSPGLHHAYERMQRDADDARALRGQR